MNQQAKLILLAIIALAVAIIVAIFMNIYTRAGMQRVDLVVVPKDATINTPIGDVSSGTHYLPYGEYEISIARDGFTTIERVIEVDKSTTVLPFALVAANEIGQKYLEENPDQVVDYEALGGTQSRKTNSEVLDRYPFIQRLPHIDIKNSFAIHYGVDEDSENLVFFVIGRSSTSGRQKAIDWLEQNRIDISQADIRYSEFTSPLKSERTVEGFNS